MKVWVCCQTVHVWSRARSPGAPLDAAVFFSFARAGDDLSSVLRPRAARENEGGGREGGGGRQTAEEWPGLIVYCVSGEATQRRLLRSGLGQHVVSIGSAGLAAPPPRPLVAPPVHAARVAVVSPVAVVAVEVSSKATWGHTHKPVLVELKG